MGIDHHGPAGTRGPSRDAFITTAHLSHTSESHSLRLTSSLRPSSQLLAARDGHDANEETSSTCPEPSQSTAASQAIIAADAPALTNNHARDPSRDEDKQADEEKTLGACEGELSTSLHTPRRTGSDTTVVQSLPPQIQTHGVPAEPPLEEDAGMGRHMVYATDGGIRLAGGPLDELVSGEGIMHEVILSLPPPYEHD